MADNNLSLSKISGISFNPFAQKVNATTPTVAMISKLKEMMPSYSFKALTSQISAMAILDEECSTGKKLDIVA